MTAPIRPSDLFRNTWFAITNPLRLFRRKGTEYAVLRISGSYPERTPQIRHRFPLSLLPWPPPPPSVETFAHTLEYLAADPRLRGVVLIISDLSAGPATLASLRRAITRFRESGKEAIAYLHYAGTWSYYLATVCDQILIPESAGFRAAGLWSETLFLKDTLALAGLEADFEAFAEYKTTPDMLRRSEMTEPHREMLEALLDSLYGELVGAIAGGRSLAEGKVRDLLDSVPLTAEQAREAGLVDGVCYEDELPALLGAPEQPATLSFWPQVRRMLARPRRWYSQRAIGVISLEGTIVSGPSRRSPFPLPLPLPLPADQAGSDTLVQQLRAAGENKRLAAVILHVDSPGGSALASDLIWREVGHLRRTKPVVVYMGNQAASGGYYVSAPANAIVAQATTLTGSIGIWGGKIVTTGLYAKVRAGRETIGRGKASGLHSEAAPFSQEERARVRTDIGAGYARFKGRVAEGRNLSEEQVETIARGRVWTGEQALARGLVDDLGDLHAAAAMARDLAGLPADRTIPLVNVPAPKQYLISQPAPADAGEWLNGLAALLREGVFALAPWAIRIRP